MSRSYEMAFEIDGVRQHEVDKVLEVIKEIWGDPGDPFIRQGYNGTCKVGVYGLQNNLCGGETEYEFATRVSRRIWEALGRFVEVEVRATCLEYIPSESYTADEEDYRLWREAVDAGTGGKPRYYAVKSERCNLRENGKFATYSIYDRVLGRKIGTHDAYAEDIDRVVETMNRYGKNATGAFVEWEEGSVKTTELTDGF